jgi:hypothetical protein
MDRNPKGISKIPQYPQFIMGLLPQAENGDELWKQKFHAANARSHHALKVP